MQLSGFGTFVIVDDEVRADRSNSRRRVACERARACDTDLERSLRSRLRHSAFQDVLVVHDSLGAASTSQISPP